MTIVIGISQYWLRFITVLIHMGITSVRLTHKYAMHVKLIHI